MPGWLRACVLARAEPAVVDHSMRQGRQRGAGGEMGRRGRRRPLLYVLWGGMWKRFTLACRGTRPRWRGGRRHRVSGHGDGNLSDEG